MKQPPPDTARHPLLILHINLAIGALIVAGCMALIAWHAAPVKPFHAASFCFAAATGTATAVWILTSACQDHRTRS